MTVTLNENASVWPPDVTGDYATDCASGREFADKLVAVMREQEKPFMLGFIVRNFGKIEAHRAAEVGFCQRIAEFAMRSQN